MKLSKTDYIMTTYAEPAAGPGWSNTPVIVIVKDKNGKIREEYLQPEEQPKEMNLLYMISHNLNRAMISLVRRKEKYAKQK